MNVEGLVSALILDASLQGLVRYDDDEEPTGKASSDYVIAARHREDIETLEQKDGWTPVEKPSNIQPWTDDYSNMLSIIRWRCPYPRRRGWIFLIWYLVSTDSQLA